MFWRKRTNQDEVEELQQFVEGMKRGQTLATGDSLLETLRQIHDRRESAVVGHDHKQMLLERMRREMRVRAGEQVNDAVRVPDFAPAPVRRRFLEMAVAASLVFHIGLGVLAIEHLRFGSIFGASTTGEIADSQSAGPGYVVTFLPPRPINTYETNASQRSTVNAPPSIGHGGTGREAPAGPNSNMASSIPSASSAPVGPPVAPGVSGPIVAGYAPAGIETAANSGLPAEAGPSADGPDRLSEVAAGRFHRVDADDVVPDDAGPVDVKAKVLYSPKPIYTSKALEFNVKGEVKLTAVLSADGTTILDIKVVRSLGYGLDEAAIDVVRRSKFTAATRGGRPVNSTMTFFVKFGIL